MTTGSKKIAIFGATGYIGLILVNRLVDSGIPLTLFVRNKQRVKHLKSYPQIESCDIELEKSNRRLIAEQLQGVDTLYYLIHSMDALHEESFEQTDLMIAETVAEAAYIANVKQIIYLGGLGVERPGHPLSMHLRNRQQVGQRLRVSGVSVTEIRAGVIIGAGSASFEIIRALGLKLPFIPRLAYHQGLCNPIDIDDVIGYLLQASKKPEYLGTTVEVGMARAYRYDEMVSLYAKVILQRDLATFNIPLLGKILTKKVLARIVSYLSAIPYALGKPLIEGFDAMAVKGEYAVEKIDDTIEPIDLVASITKAAEDEKAGKVESFWSIPKPLQVLSRDKEEFIHIDRSSLSSDAERYREQGLLFEIRERYVDVDEVDMIFDEIKKIGGEYGYWSPHWLWKIRAFADKMVGGPGLEVGRRTDKAKIRIGERLDFWIVSAYLDTEERKVLTLKGRIKSPGDSWLQFALIEEENGWRFTIRAYFNPSGLFGYLYWYSLYFVHKYIFDAMMDNILAEARKR